MRRLALILAATLSWSLAACANACHAGYLDAGPNDVDGSGDHSHSAAGLTYQLAGDDSALYAVSLNAGIWKRVPGGTWTQLHGSSVLTTVMAIDPLDPNHLASGDRNGEANANDSTLVERTLSSIWESHDAGETTWQQTFLAPTRNRSPQAPAGCTALNSQAIASLAFTPTGTLLAGTSCGLGRRAVGDPTFSFDASPATLGVVSALAVTRQTTSQSIIWALGADVTTQFLSLLSSTDDGVSWSAVAIPATVDGYGVPQMVGQGAPGDTYSLAAFGQKALLIFRPVPGRPDNKSMLIYFDRETGAFSSQVLDDANDGTHLGGRRWVRSVPVSPPFAVGNGLRLFVGAAEDVLEGTSVDKSGFVNWRSVVKADCAKCPDDRDPVHADLWDVLPSRTSQKLWIASDGGVFEKGSGFRSINDGLHTHHIADLVTLGQTDRPRMLYATIDNDAWFVNDNVRGAAWKSLGKLGDATWVRGDKGSPALGVANRHESYNVIMGFDSPNPSGAQHVDGDRISLDCTGTVGNPCSGAGVAPQTWQVVQTGRNETPSPLLDVVWLKHLPLTYRADEHVTALTGDLASAAARATGSTLLLRNAAFAKNPDINESNYDGWTLEASNLPLNSSRMWVSGGHGYYPAVYFVCTCDRTPTRLFKQTTRNGPWADVTPIIFDAGHYETLTVVAPSTNDVSPTIRGPLWVSPTDPSRLVVATTRGPAMSDTGGSTFQLDPVLRALLTNSDQYPLDGGFHFANELGVVHAAHGATFMYISDVAFGPQGYVAVSSPYTGVFYRSASTAPWRNLTTALPTPLPAISSISLWGGELYVATEGRGLLQTAGAGYARIASYFSWTSDSRASRTGGGTKVNLLRADGTAVAGAAVSIRRIAADGSGQTLTVVTTTTGEVALTAPITSGDLLFLSYVGDSTTAPATTVGR